MSASRSSIDLIGNADEVSRKTTKRERKYKTERKSKMGKQKIDREAPMASLGITQKD